MSNTQADHAAAVGHHALVVGAHAVLVFAVPLREHPAELFACVQAVGEQAAVGDVVVEPLHEPRSQV